MTKGALLSAAVILSAVFVNPLRAQAVISYPGACAQLYPDANCENHGPGNLYDGGYGSNTGTTSNAYAVDDRDSSYCTRRYRSYDPASGTYLGHDGRRHPCQ
jgi:BA14K-like protein